MMAGTTNVGARMMTRAFLLCFLYSLPAAPSNQHSFRRAAHPRVLCVYHHMQQEVPEGMDSSQSREGRITRSSTRPGVSKTVAEKPWMERQGTFECHTNVGRCYSSISFRAIPYF